MRVPRIACTGASGTGKTTITEWLSARLSVPINPEGSRSTAERMGFIGEDGRVRPYLVDVASLAVYETLERHAQVDARFRDIVSFRTIAATAVKGYRPGEPTCRRLFQQRLLDAKVSWELAHMETGFVTDRTTCDNLVYSALQDVHAVSQQYVADALNHVPNYDIVLEFPVTVFRSTDADAARIEEPTYHALYEMMLFGVLATARRYCTGDTEFVTMVEPSIEGRQEVLEQLCRGPRYNFKWTPE